MKRSILRQLAFAWVVVAVASADAAWAAGSGPITAAEAAAAAKVAGVEFSEAERIQMLPALQDRLGALAELRAVPLPNPLAPALVFDPRPPGFVTPVAQKGLRWTPPRGVKRRVKTPLGVAPSTRYGFPRSPSIFTETLLT